MFLFSATAAVFRIKYCCGVNNLRRLGVLIASDRLSGFTLMTQIAQQTVFVTKIESVFIADLPHNLILGGTLLWLTEETEIQAK